MYTYYTKNCILYYILYYLLKKNDKHLKTLINAFHQLNYTTMTATNATTAATATNATNATTATNAKATMTAIATANYDNEVTEGHPFPVCQWATFSLVGPCRYDVECRSKFCPHSHSTPVRCSFNPCRNYHCRFSHTLTKVLRERVPKEVYNQCMPTRCGDTNGKILSGRLRRQIRNNGEIAYSLIIPTKLPKDQAQANDEDQAQAKDEVEAQAAAAAAKAQAEEEREDHEERDYYAQDRDYDDDRNEDMREEMREDMMNGDRTP